VGAGPEDPGSWPHDPAGMMARVVSFPEQLRAALAAAREGPELCCGARASRVLVVGMGGSAIGGDFLSTFAAERSTQAIAVVRGYELPLSARRDTFAFFVSYSGNTEETLACWEQAASWEVPRACITSGGELAARARSAGVPVLLVPSGLPPRAALGWTSVPMFWALARSGLLEFEPEELEEAARAVEEVIAEAGPGANAENPLRRWAETAARRLPFVYAPSRPFGCVGLRWVCQLNENGKTLGHLALFPEHNHNEVVGLEIPSPVHELLHVALLHDAEIHPRVRRRLELVADLVRGAGGRAEWFAAKGKGLLARLFSLAVQGDLASVYLAGALQVDPTPVASIDRLKKALAGAGQDEY
jgi:glucose/mannose-6-phosphate isomerase